MSEQCDADCAFLMCNGVNLHWYKLNEKFCVNCKYFIPNIDSIDKYGKCSMFSLGDSKFLFSGNNNDRDFYYCSSARGSNNLCGKNATKYVKKYKKYI